MYIYNLNYLTSASCPSASVSKSTKKQTVFRKLVLFRSLGKKCGESGTFCGVLTSGF